MDEKIVKALEHCSHNRSCEYCYHNGEAGSGEIVCRSRLMKKVLDLIHRQKAEIERLTEERDKHFIKATLYYAICKGCGIDNFYDEELDVANKGIEVE